MPSIKGTASISSNSALQKQLRSTTFPSNFSQKVNIAKVHRTVFTHWIEKRIEAILGFEDDIVSSTAVHLFLPSSGDDDSNATAVDYWDVDPRRAQLDLAGFLGEGEAATFAAELWTMMLDAQTSPSGIPRVLVEKKKEEMRLQREEMDRKRLQQQQQARRGGGANYHHDGVGDASNNDMNAFVREAARRAEAARAAILPGAGAAIGGAAAVAGGHPAAAAAAVPAAVNMANSGPVPVPPSPSPPRHYDGGRGGGGGVVRGDNYDHRGGRYNRGGGAGGDNYYEQRRNNTGGGRNYDAYYDNRRDYNYDGYHRRNDYFIDRKGERGQDGGTGRSGGRWEDLDEFGRGRRDEFGGGNSHPTDRSRQPLNFEKHSGDGSGSGAAIKGEGGGCKDNKLDTRKEPSSKENENDKASQQPSLRRVGVGSEGIVGKDDGVKPTRKSSRSASRSMSNSSSSRSSLRSSSRSRSSTSGSYSSSNSGSSSSGSRSRSYSSSRSRSRSRSASSSPSHHSRERDQRKYKTHRHKATIGAGSKRSGSRSRSKERGVNKRMMREGCNKERSSSTYKDRGGSHSRHSHHRHHHKVDKKDSSRKEGERRRW